MTINQQISSNEYTITPIYDGIRLNMGYYDGIRLNIGYPSCALCGIEYEYTVFIITDFQRKKRILCPTDLFHMAHSHPKELLKSKKRFLSNGQVRSLDQTLIDEIRQYDHEIKTKTNS